MKLIVCIFDFTTFFYCANCGFGDILIRYVISICMCAYVCYKSITTIKVSAYEANNIILVTEIFICDSVHIPTAKQTKHGQALFEFNLFLLLSFGVGI